MSKEPSRGVKPVDMDAVGEAVDLLREAGYAVDEVGEVRRNESQGVTFDLTLARPTRVKPLGEEEPEAEEGELIPDGGTVEKSEPEETLRLTDEGIEMPDMLRGYKGQFHVRTADITGQFNTTESGLPDTEFWDGVIAVYPDDDGDYNPHLGPGLMEVYTTSKEESVVYEVKDERTEDEEGEA